MIYQSTLPCPTRGRGTIEITAEIQRSLDESGVRQGLCTVFAHHTSASLIICENADPTVRSDLEAWLARAVPDGDGIFEHTAEGPDDMPAHVRSALTSTSIGIPVVDGRLDLGTWQGIFLYEHRLAESTRRVTLTIQGQ